MAIRELFSSLKGDKKALAAVTLLGSAGLVLILISSLIPGSSGDGKPSGRISAQQSEISSEDYCAATEQRLEEFLRNIDGVGEVRVYLTVNSGEEYVYATEGRSAVSENKKEEELQYVMIGGSSGKSALVEKVKAPQISGAVIACSGCDSAAVQEKVYKAVSAALNLPTSKIYVTKLKS